MTEPTSWMADPAVIGPIAGLAAGVIHVVSGPDHLAAVLPFAVSKPRHALRVGLFWGIGHGLGVLVLGLLFMVAGQAFSIDGVSQRAESLVGVLLIGLGLWAIRRSRRIVIHSHGHGHDGHSHAHPHVHVNDPTVADAHHPVVGRHERHHHSTLGFGFVHGVAGVGHLVVASPLIALSGAGAAFYLLAYLVGGVLAMTGFSLAAGSLIRRPSWIPASLALAGVASVGVGIVWLSA